MSASGRGPRLGGPHDLYDTSAWCVRRLLEAWKPHGGLWLEPGAGHGTLAQAVLDARPDVDLVAVEIDPPLELALLDLPRTQIVMGDFLTAELPTRLTDTHVVIGNPPYRDDLALAFIQRAQAVCPVAHVAFLLPLAFLASQRRQPWLAANPPDLYVLPNRPLFRGDGTDQAEYGWFIWPPAVWNELAARTGRSRVGSLSVLTLTSKEERRRDFEACRDLRRALGEEA